ncbi:MAG: hypothetical protein QOH91_1243 [Mycobacterium sp.]|jgi:hypothetical protein|nr:hypothetical protein [Mycobacterium sp.]
MSFYAVAVQLPLPELRLLARAWRVARQFCDQTPSYCAHTTRAGSPKPGAGFTPVTDAAQCAAVTTTMLATGTRADECIWPLTSYSVTDTRGDWAEIKARRPRRRRWWILSVPNHPRNIALPRRDVVVGVADTRVPTYWVHTKITGLHRGVPGTPVTWSGWMVFWTAGPGI